jgi:acetylornithine deacetylase/succinyl-diaminopimelate desuccinylase-like protein
MINNTLRARSTGQSKPILLMADNALPQVARAMINCRILPNHSTEEMQSTLVRVLADDKIPVTPDQPTPEL